MQAGWSRGGTQNLFSCVLFWVFPLFLAVSWGVFAAPRRRLKNKDRSKIFVLPQFHHLAPEHGALARNSTTGSGRLFRRPAAYGSQSVQRISRAHCVSFAHLRCQTRTTFPRARSACGLEGGQSSASTQLDTFTLHGHVQFLSRGTTLSFFSACTGSAGVHEHGCWAPGFVWCLVFCC